MILLVLEAHGALHFGSRVDELAQRIERQHVIVAARVDEVEFARLVVIPLRVFSGEKKAFNFVGGVERVALFLVELVGVSLENSAQIAGVGCAVLVDDRAENQHLAVAEHVGGNPVEGAPVDAQAQVALLLRGKSANRRAVEGQILMGAQQKLLVVVEQVQAAFQIREQYRHCLDVLLVCQVLDPLIANLLDRQPAHAVCLGLQVQFFKLLVREGKKIPVVQ